MRTLPLVDTSGDPVESAVQKRMFHSLDGLRGIAAIVVVCLHCQAYVAPFSPRSAYLAVDLFFALSGFVLAFAYQDKLDAGMSAHRFMRMRLIRLYPFYALGLLIALVTPIAALCMSSARHWTWGALAISAIPALLFLPGPPVSGRQPALYQFNFPAWSLFFELGVNALYAATARHQRWLAPAIVAICAPLIVATAWRNGSLDGGWLWTEWQIGAVRVLFSFFVGILAYRLYRGGSFPRINCPVLLPFAAVAGLLCFGPDPYLRPVYDVVCVTVLFPIAVWLCICNEPRRGMRFCSTVGVISFPIYAIHRPILALLLDPADRFSGGKIAELSPWIGIAIIIAMAWVCLVLARTFDTYARQCLQRLFS